MYRHLEDHSRVSDPEQRLSEDQVTAAGHRQELGQTLHDPENERLNKAHSERSRTSS
jgi:hypothetical protein